MAVIITALLQALMLILFIVYVDRRRPEPMRLMLQCFFAGAVSVIPAIVLEQILDPVLSGSAALLALNPAVVEEVCKGALLYLVLRKTSEFDEHIDGIVYAVCAGTGFGFVENIGYFFMYPDSVALRLMTPGHFFFGILMGYFLSRARFTTGERKRNNFILALAAPMAAHWTWDFLCFISGESTLALILFIVGGLAFYGGLILWSSRKLKEQYKRDTALYAAQEAYNAIPEDERV